MTPINRFFIKNDIRQEQRGIIDLALDIKANTLLQPIVVQQSGDDFEILDGRRRFTAMRDYLKMDGLEENLHFIVREGLHALAVQFAANEHRENFTPVEKAGLIYQIHTAGVDEMGVATRGKRGSGWTLEDTAKVINRDKGYISRMLQVYDHKARFKDCRTELECFETLKREKEKKILQRVKKAKIDKVKEAGDISFLFKSIKCSSAETFLPSVESESIDLIHTDPPFAINYDELIKAQYDAPYEDDPDEVMRLLNVLIPEFYRVLKNDRYCIVWSGYLQGLRLIDSFEKAGFTVLPTPIVWMKLSTAGKTHQPNIRLGSATQYAICAWKGMPELNIKGRHNYFPYPIVRENRIHQAQMPEELIMDLVRIFSAEGDLVLDCFAGSLSTLRACFSVNRRFIGCELQEKNIENGISYSIDWIAKKERV